MDKLRYMNNILCKESY